MAGIQINLKGKGISKKTGTNKLNKPGLGIRKKILEEKTLKKPNALKDSESDDDDDEVKTVFISSFDKIGDQSTENTKEKKLTIIPEKLQASIPRQKPYLPNQDQQLVIEEKEEKLKYGLNTRIPKQETSPDDVNISDEEMPQTLEERARESLLKGESAVDSSGRSIPMEDLDNDINVAPEEATAEEYENVPVEEFGAALLRGMGWKANNKKSLKKMPELSGKKGLFLGIGAKTEEADIMEELVAKKGVTFKVPLVKKENKD